MTSYEPHEPTLLKEPRRGVPAVTDTRADFDRIVRRFARATGPVAADAERASGFRYGHEDWLIQFKRGDAGIALIDPPALTALNVSWDELNQAFGDGEWILHDSLQDLPGYTDLGLRPRALFDTEMAARMAGCQRFGLAACTERYLGITLAKEHAAADWSYRPLPRDLRAYAALDVEVLIELRDALAADLRAQGKAEWARQEFAYLLDVGTRPRRQPAEPWRRTHDIARIGRDRRGLAVVRELWEERDALARRLDIAPSLLLTDSTIIEAAEAKPRNHEQFAAIRGLNERVRMRATGEREKMYERYAPLQRQARPSVWREAIARALALPASQLPAEPARPESGQGGGAPKSLKYWGEHHPDRLAMLDAARNRMNVIAQDVNTPVDVLLKPAVLRNLCWQVGEGDVRLDPQAIADYLASQEARPWQVDLLSRALYTVLASL